MIKLIQQRCATTIVTGAAAVVRPTATAAVSTRQLHISSLTHAVSTSSFPSTGAYVPHAPAGYGLACGGAITGASGALNLPTIKNEPMYNYAPGDSHRIKLEQALKSLLAAKPLAIPTVIGDQEIYPSGSGSNLIQVTSPSRHAHVLAIAAETSETQAKAAIDACLSAKSKWEALPFSAKAAIFLKAADLLSSPKYRYDMLASVMVGQGKNVWQAEIDAAAEAIDFWRFNVQYAAQIYAQLQPSEHSPTVWNRVEYRALEGFILAIAPFNFAAIGANLASAPALMGNTVLWKPSNTALHSNWLMYKILREAGLPAGVIQFLPGAGLGIGKQAFSHPEFAGLHFTGSTRTFRTMWSTIGQNVGEGKYKSFPRIVGETGGKNFHFVHASADPDHVVYQSIRSAFEYAGQKCSALSRMYVPQSLWPAISKGLKQHTQDIINKQFGDIDNFTNFLGPVIDERSYDRLSSVLQQAKTDAKSGKIDILVGGDCDRSKGWYIQPTVLVCKQADYTTMRDELFGPVLSVYVYPDAEYEHTLEICDRTSPYALTGSLFASDRYALEFGAGKLRNASGNFYINDKSTGAVVGQQPFGGARGSGTNDKAGAMQNLLRWTSPRAIKETMIPISTYKYPHQG